MIRSRFIGDGRFFSKEGVIVSVGILRIRPGKVGKDLWLGWERKIKVFQIHQDTSDWMHHRFIASSSLFQCASRSLQNSDESLFFWSQKVVKTKLENSSELLKYFCHAPFLALTEKSKIQRVPHWYGIVDPKKKSQGILSRWLPCDLGRVSSEWKGGF